MAELLDMLGGMRCVLTLLLLPLVCACLLSAIHALDSSAPKVRLIAAQGNALGVG